MPGGVGRTVVSDVSASSVNACVVVLVTTAGVTAAVLVFAWSIIPFAPWCVRVSVAASAPLVVVPVSILARALIRVITRRVLLPISASTFVGALSILILVFVHSVLNPMYFTFVSFFAAYFTNESVTKSAFLFIVISFSTVLTRNTG